MPISLYHVLHGTPSDKKQRFPLRKGVTFHRAWDVPAGQHSQNREPRGRKTGQQGAHLINYMTTWARKEGFILEVRSHMQCLNILVFFGEKIKRERERRVKYHPQHACPLLP